MREIALKFFANSAETADLPQLSAIAQDALGFSYFLFERDTEKALQFISKATSSFSSLHRMDGTGRRAGTSISKVQARFFAGFAAAAFWDLGVCYETKAETTEGESAWELTTNAKSCYQTALDLSRFSPWHLYRALCSYNLSGVYFREGQNQTDKRAVLKMLKRSISLGEASLRWFKLWSIFEADFLGGSWISSYYQGLAIFSEGPERKRLMARSIELAKRAEVLVTIKKIGLSRYKSANLGDIFTRNSEYYRRLALDKKYAGSIADTKVTELFLISLRNCLKARSFYRNQEFESRKLDSSLLAGDIHYELMNSADEKDRVQHARSSKRSFSSVIRACRDLGLYEKAATSHWRLAQVLDREGKYSDSASEYQFAHEAYERAKANAQNSLVYFEPSIYMVAWADIENAKLAHKRSEFEKAADSYRRAAKLIQNTRRWQTRSKLYKAEALIEEAEKESINENFELSQSRFEDALIALKEAREESKAEASLEAKSIASVGNQLERFCSARILLEKSKDSFRKGFAGRSIYELFRAEKIFSKLATVVEGSDPQLSNELHTLAGLCNGLKTLQLAQENKDSKLYLAAREIFAQAAKKSSSKSLGYLLSGLSHFAGFLGSSLLIEESLESSLNVEKLVECDEALDSAEADFQKLGNKTFLSMLRASKHILNATVNISAAEREMEKPQERSRLYREAQKSL